METNHLFFFLSDALLRIITDFYRREEVKKLSADQGLDIRLFQDAYVSFRKFCLQSTVLPVDLHIVFSDIISESGNVLCSHPDLTLHVSLSPRSCDRSLSLLSSTRERNVSSSDLYGGSEEDQRPSRSSQLVMTDGQSENHCSSTLRHLDLGIPMPVRYNGKSSFMLDPPIVAK
jgi:hypothetical protein